MLAPSGFPITAAVAVGIRAAIVAILRLPLSAVVVTALLTAKAGAGADPLVILGVVVSYLVTRRLSALQSAKSTSKPAAANETSNAPAPAAAEAT